MSDCDSCKQYCMQNSEISLDACMQNKCPACVSASVCQTQKTFDQAVRKAIKYVQKENRLSTVSLLVIFVLFIGVILWALSLSSRVSDRKILHTILALLAAPFYIIAYYLDQK